MKRLPKRSGEYLFQVVMRRHELRSKMMTSNPTSKLKEGIDDMAEAGQRLVDLRNEEIGGNTAVFVAGDNGAYFAAMLPIG